MARPADKAPMRRLEILESFYHVLAEEGLQEASLAKIAKRMGVQPSLLIHYYSTKEEMIEGLVEFITRRYEETFFPELEGVRDPQERLERSLDMLFGPEWFRLVDNGAFYACYYLSFRNERIRDLFRKMYLRLREVVAEEIRRYWGTAGPDREPAEKTADLVLIILGGFNYQKNIFPGDARFDELGRRLKGLAFSLIQEAGRQP